MKRRASSIAIRSAAKALGGDVSGRNNVLCPGPGHSARDRSLSVTFDGDDFVVFSHSGDGWAECRDHVRGRLGLGESRIPERNSRRRSQLERPLEAPAEDRDRTERALAIWQEARPITGTPAEIYLAGRGLSYDGEALRWHPACPFGKGERYGCMIAIIRGVVDHKPQAIHRTAIDANGHKIDRKAYGPIGGGAVKLTDDADVTTVIAIAEGIETALSIRDLPELSTMPVWSLISANGIAAFPALPGIETVWIAADHDVSGTGLKAARAAAERLEAAGIETIIIVPTEAGADLNDIKVPANA